MEHTPSPYQPYLTCGFLKTAVTAKPTSLQLPLTNIILSQPLQALMINVRAHTQIQMHMDKHIHMHVHLHMLYACTHAHTHTHYNLYDAKLHAFCYKEHLKRN